MVLDLLFPASNDCNPELNRTGNETYQKKQTSSGVELAQIGISASSDALGTHGLDTGGAYSVAADAFVVERYVNP